MKVFKYNGKVNITQIYILHQKWYSNTKTKKKKINDIQQPGHVFRSRYNKT